MKLMTISDVSRSYNVSTRMLRYYDSIGLLSSTRTEDYAYRTYDEDAVRRLRQIILLRKLRIPLKSIAEICADTDGAKTAEVFRICCAELDGEITALKTIREILRIYLSRFKTGSASAANTDLLDDDEVIGVIETLSLSRINFKEERSMEKLNEANNTLKKLSDVRILHLPPFTAVSSHFIGASPEAEVGKGIIEFIKESGLAGIKPDARVYGFNNPNPSPNAAEYGYEFLVTVPDDFPVPEPYQKKTYKGGSYAAHCIKMGDFHEWEWLCEWAEDNEDYMPDYSAEGGANMGGCLEDHLNFLYYAGKETEFPWNDVQIDLLLPIKPRK